MARILLFATTTGYQTRLFGDAAERLDVELVFATDRCDMLDDPWQDHAIPIRFHHETASVAAVLSAVASHPIDGLLVVGDRPTVIAARVAEALGLAGHPPEAAAIARNKQRTRERLRACGLPIPAFLTASLDGDLSDVRASISFPAVVKPLALSGSRGVIRVNDERELAQGLDRLRSILASPDIRAERNEAHRSVLVEEFIPGHEFALEGLMHDGVLHTLAVFDKPDPLDGPFFEETIYVTPALTNDGTEDAVKDAVGAAARAIGLWHGPIHAECRVNEAGVFVLEIAARPIGGLCARALNFEKRDRESTASLEELLIRHALGEPPDLWKREAAASGVMMIPIPSRGIFRGVEGEDAARAIDGIVDMQITAKPDQRLSPLPEGASYLGFIFARASTSSAVDRALRAAHQSLRFTVSPEVAVVQSRYG